MGQGGWAGLPAPRWSMASSPPFSSGPSAGQICGRAAFSSGMQWRCLLCRVARGRGGGRHEPASNNDGCRLRGLRPLRRNRRKRCWAGKQASNHRRDVSLYFVRARRFGNRERYPTAQETEWWNEEGLGCPAKVALPPRPVESGSRRRVLVAVRARLQRRRLEVSGTQPPTVHESQFLQAEGSVGRPPELRGSEPSESGGNRSAPTRGAPWGDPADTSRYPHGRMESSCLSLCPRGRPRSSLRGSRL